MLNLKQKMELVDLLVACPLLQDRAGRDLVIQELGFGAAIKRDSRDRVDVVGLVNSCLAYPDGIEMLLHAMRLYEGNLLPLPFQAVLAKWEELQRGSIPPKPDVQAMPKTKIPFDWVTIPAGEFWMGTDLQQDKVAAGFGWAIETECPQHEVYLPEYHLARVPVTNEQWGIFLEQSHYNWASRNELWKNGLPRGKEKHPVVYVTWADALAFCEWAGVMLPSEAEWEKAARGNDQRLYPWGNQKLTHSLANFNGNVGNTTAVGQYPAGKSFYGCLDMAGNVWEWTRTIWGKDETLEFKYPYKAGDGREDVIDIDILRVLRGGSWYNGSRSLRCAYRLTINFGSDDIGFRVCLPPF